MFYLFHGEDTHTKKQILTELIAKIGDPSMMDLNTTRLEGKGLTAGQLQDACNAMPFLAPKRVVIVTDFFANKPDKKVVTAVQEYLLQLPDTTRLFFLESTQLADSHSLIKLAQEHKEKGVIRHFEKPQGAKLEQWISQKAAELGGKIDPRAAHLLAINVGSELDLLEQEVTKLVMYKGVSDSPAVITSDDVVLLSPYAAEVNIFDLVDALGSRNGKRAAELLHKKLEVEAAEPFSIFSMFVRQFRLLIQVKELQEQGLQPAGIAQELKQSPFVVKKVAQQSQAFSLHQLEQIYAHLLTIDIGVKTGRTDLITALNMLVFSLSTS